MQLNYIYDDQKFFLMNKIKTQITAVLLFILINLSFSNKINSQSLSDSSYHYFEKIFKSNPSSAFANYGLAVWYFNKENYQKAIEHAKMNIRKTNDFDTTCYLIYARSLELQGKYNKAEGMFKKALQKFPYSYPLWFYYGFYHYKLRNYNLAESAVKKSIEINPYLPLTHYLLGFIWLENNNSSNCLSAFLYGIMMDTDTLRTISMLSIIDNFVNKNYEALVIPFFEKRLGLKTPNQLIFNYISENNQTLFYKKLNPIFYTSALNEKLQQNDEKTNIYSKFYIDLKNKNLLETFLWLCLKNIPRLEISQWYASNSNKLNELANFLEDNLIPENLVK